MSRSNEDRVRYQPVGQAYGDSSDFRAVSPMKSHHQTRVAETGSSEALPYGTSYQNSQYGTDALKPPRDVGPPRKTSIGFWTPTAIVLFFLLATAIAVGHYLYCHFLNGRFIESTIPQSWNTVISMAFSRAFSTALAASASTAFTQLLWWYLRRKALSLEKIDALCSMNTSPMKLLQLGLLVSTPLLWFLGLLLPLISVASIFPPGSLVVLQTPDMHREMMEVPVLNVDYRGNSSAETFFEHAVFKHDIEGDIKGPNIHYLGIGRQTVMGNAFLPRPSPCGANCSYTVSFNGPGMHCEDASTPPVLQSSVHYQAALNASTHTFDISYRTREGGGVEWGTEEKHFHYGGLRNLSCTTLDVEYTAHVAYLNSVQSVELDVTSEKPLNESALKGHYHVLSVMNSKPSPNGFVEGEIGYGPFDVELFYRKYHVAQLASIRETLTEPMSGWIKAIGDVQVYNTSTTIQESPLAELVYDTKAYQFLDIYFNLSPDVLKRLMQNVTISMLNDAKITTTTKAEVTKTEYKAAYIFQDKLRLVVVYAGTLGVCLVFILLGLGALVQNGTPAFSGGFTQVMCATTYGGSVMNQMARDGSDDVLDELAKLKVRYGLVTDGVSQRKYAAFGTVEETEVLLKGSKS